MRLVHVSDRQPGIARRRCGKGFAYFNHRGQRLRDAVTLQRICALVIPPAWSRVWICAKPNGYLQATGRDARGRKQYRYHDAWRKRRDANKFARLAQFGQCLPKLRTRLRQDLAACGLCRAKVLAVAVSLLDATLIRVGNRQYARDNHSYGLTTLRAKHVAFMRNGCVRLHFNGKSGKSQNLKVDDVRLVRILRRCNELPGRSLFQYRDEKGKRQRVDSSMINAYVRSAMDDAFSAKDFRTWGATTLAVAAFLREPAPDNPREQHAASVRVTRQVAAALGNTAAVCRASYICPAVYADWQFDNGLLRNSPPRIAAQPRKLEKLTLKLIEPT